MKFGVKLSKALPAYNVFTACDYRAAFSRKGIVQQMKFFLKHEFAQELFGSMGGNDNGETILNKIKKYTCKIYSVTTLAIINELFIETAPPNLFRKIGVRKNSGKIIH